MTARNIRAAALIIIGCTFAVAIFLAITVALYFRVSPYVAVLWIVGAFFFAVFIWTAAAVSRREDAIDDFSAPEGAWRIM